MTASTTIAKLSGYIAEAQAYAKFLSATVGGLLIVVAQFLPEEWVLPATAVVAAVTAFSVYKFPNVTTAADGAHEA